jgi:glucosamine-6-phosphate deaminase
MEKIVCKDYDELSGTGAQFVADAIRRKPDCILGLATGSTPVGMYKRLIEMHKKAGLDFSRVRTFNVDEYYPIAKANDQSYDYFMWANLFSHININKENVHLPNGECADPAAECLAYEQLLHGSGGIDLQVLGIGVNGHVGFNEPAPALTLNTHLTGLAPSTIEANARFFKNADEVPRQSITMGMGTIMQAKAILLLISGANKAAVAARLFDGTVSTEIPASFLHLHPNVTVILDEKAAGRA